MVTVCLCLTLQDFGWKTKICHNNCIDGRTGSSLLEGFPVCITFLQVACVVFRLFIFVTLFQNSPLLISHKENVSPEVVLLVVCDKVRFTKYRICSPCIYLCIYLYINALALVAHFSLQCNVSPVAKRQFYDLRSDEVF